MTVGAPSQVRADVVRGVMPDGDDRAGIRHQLRTFSIGTPACGTERIELRRVGQIDHAARRGFVSGAQ